MRQFTVCLFFRLFEIMSVINSQYIHAVQLKNVSFTYKNKQKDVLKQLNFQLPFGSSLTIFGTNGSGKTTLGKLLVGLLLHFRGEITILDQVLNNQTHREIICNVGIVFQNADSQFIGEDVENDIVFGLENLNVSPSEMFVRLQNIATKLQLGDILHHQPAQLSAGQKQHVAIASALVTDPKIIIFDESTTVLGTNAKKQILTIINRLKQDPNITVIEITHDTERVLNSDFVLLLKEGEQTFFGKGHDLLLNYPHLFSDAANLELPFIYRLSTALQKTTIIDRVLLDKDQLVTNL